MLSTLAKVANKLDSLGLTKEADALDKLISKLAATDDVLTLEEEQDYDMAEHGFGKHPENTMILSEPEERDIVSPARQRVIDAIKRSVGDPYFENIFIMRNPGSASEGSTFVRAQTPETLMASTWERWNHPAVEAPAIAFKAPSIAGHFGILDLEKLPSDLPISITKDHKGAGNNAVCIVTDKSVQRPLSRYTTMLLGPGEDGEVVWTFFPRPPTSPSNLPWDDSMIGIKTAGDALSAGFKYGKLGGS